MPIIRREEATDPLAPHIAYLWKKKWWVILPSAIVLVLTYLVLRTVPGEYKAAAQIYVNRMAFSPQMDREELPSPSTVAQLLKSDMVLHQVRTDYQKEFNLARVPEFERFARAFKVKSEILQDTSVRKDVSPVLSLEVQSAGTSETRFLMESWLKHSVHQFGNYAVNEAVMKRDALRANYDATEKTIRERETSRTRLRTEILKAEKMYAEMLNLLAPAELNRTPDLLAPRDHAAQNRDGDTNVHVKVDNNAAASGLLKQASELSIAIQMGETTAGELREFEAVRNTITEAESSASLYQKQLAEANNALGAIEREIELLRGFQNQLNQSLSRFNAESALYREENIGGLPIGGDLRVLAGPVQPELRVWPKRTLSAAVAALVAAVICVFSLLLYRYSSSILPAASR